MRCSNLRIGELLDRVHISASAAGCQYQHASYTQQITLKLDILRETLERARISALPEIVPIYAEPLAYRNRIRLHLQGQPFALCYKKQLSHANLPVLRCPIAAPILERAIQIVTQIGERFRLAQGFEEIEFFTNETQTELLVSLRTSMSKGNQRQELQLFCEALRQELPVFTGAAVFSTNATKLAEWGAQALTYRVGGYTYRVSIGSFFQVNRFLVDRLLEFVVPAHSGKLAWDLYAGVGLFSQALTTRFERVLAVEGSAYSSNDLKENIHAAHKTVRSETLQFLQKQSTSRSHLTAPDLIVVDPPRTGLGGSVVSMLTKVRPQAIVYAPATRQHSRAICARW